MRAATALAQAATRCAGMGDAVLGGGLAPLALVSSASRISSSCRENSLQSRTYALCEQT